MGKKNKNRGGNDDQDFTEGDFSTKFVSNKAAVAKEMAEAQRAVNQDDSDEAAANKKQQRKRKGAAQELNDEFGEEAKATKVAAMDSDHEIDLQKEMEENFEGISKKNTRKKKNNNTNVYGGQDALAGAFDDQADEDEIYAKKGGKTQKGGKHQGKKGKKKQAEESDQEEEPKEEVKEQVQEKNDEVKDESEGEKEFPINMIYCGKCGLPPEYCEFGQKDVTGCKEWLNERYPQMYAQIYGEPIPKTEVEEEKKDGEGEGKGEGEGDKQPKKKVKFGKDPDSIGVITVYKQKRGGRKVVSQIIGFEHYTKDLKGLASKFGKKFSCGSNIATDEIHGECISVQGDVEDRLLDILEQDKDLAAFNIPFEKIKFVEDGNKKGRKRPGPGKPSE